jgi:DNA polymerase III subunit delta'
VENRYVPLYDRLVPLSAIAGHAPLVGLLRRAVARGRVPQSLLFAGPNGVGKKAVALALAQAVNCPMRLQASRGKPGAAIAVIDDACGKCTTCQRIARGQHTDVTLIDRGDEASIKIQPIRERVLGVIGYRPFEAERRVYIIDGADDMTPQAQDALLKTLEEPPPAAIIILVTALPDTLHATVLSRCRRLRFSPLSDQDVARVLVERCSINAKEAGVLAAVSGGSVARALAEEAGSVADDRDAALALLVAAARSTAPASRLMAAAALAKVEARRRPRETLSSRLAAIASLMRDLTLIGTGSQQPLANPDLRADLQRLAPAFGSARVSTGYTAITRAEEALERNVSPKLVADWTALNL